MSLKMRQEVEKKIVGKFVTDALAQGYRLAVSLERGWDTDDMLHASSDYEKIMDAAFAGDECHIFLQPPTGPTIKDGTIVSEGWVFCVFGNDGWDVINDYTTNLESLMSGANKLSDEYQ